MGFKSLGILGDQLRVGPNGYELRTAKWDCLSAAAQVPKAPAKDLRLKARVDVCYDADEKAARYAVVPRYDQPAFPPFQICGDLEGRKIVDGARLLVGGDEMSVDATPGRDLWVVMRVYPTHEMPIHGGFGSRNVIYAFANPLSISVFVDGADAGTFKLKTPDAGFGDVGFRIPGEVVTSPHPRISILGDRIVAGYWFYQ